VFPNLPANINFRISPALWEEPRCYWCTGGVDKIITLRELPPDSRSKWQFRFVQSGDYRKIAGHDGYLYVDGAKLKSTAKDPPLNGFNFKQHNTYNAYFSIAQQQNPLSLLACEDGNLGNSTDIQVYAHSFMTDKWTDFSEVPSDAFPFLWKVDRADIRVASWMDQLPDKTKKLNELAICGTHDSCTWKWSSGNYSRTQDLTVFEQLNIGIRYLDIRLGPDFETYHGGKNGVSFQDVINDIATFLSNSRNETIIMVIAGGDGLASFATDLRDVVNRTSRRVTNNLSWFSENRVPALNEVPGKVVLLRRYEDKQANPPGIDLSMWGPVHSNDSFSATGIGGVSSIEVQDEYSLTQNSTKKGYIEKLLPSMAIPALTSQHWYMNFTSAAKLQHPSWYSNDINPWLGSQLNFHNFMRGTFVMDFPSAAIVERIVLFNF
jgi:1-phosphatidylinositol phosphodiesterase